MSYDVQWLRDEVARLLDFDSTQADQAYAGGTNDVWSTIDAALTRAYTKIVNETKLEVPHAHFKMNLSITWPASQQTYVLPDDIATANLLSFWDVTDSDMGIKMFIYDTPVGVSLYWKDYKTIQWGTEGPPSARTLKLDYIANPEELNTPAQVPVLVPYRHRHLLMWEGAIQARLEADEDNIPRLWLSEAGQCMQRYIVDLSKGKLQFSNRARILDLDQQDIVEVRQ